MSILRRFACDRRVWLLLLLGILTVVVSRYSLGSKLAVRVVVKGGYWALVAIVGLLGYTLAPLVRDFWKSQRVNRHRAGILCLILVAGGVLLTHERYGFKILADEVLLAGTAMEMHYSRNAAYPVRATDVRGPFEVLENVLDKRPFFFPFLVCVVHDFTGYRVENAFYLNTVLGLVFLGLVYAMGRKLGGTPWAGAFLILLFAGLPLLSQQMKGGGFDLLNVVMIALVTLLAMRFAERRDERSAQAVCLAAVLLAYTRYESIILLVPVAAVLVWGWWREQRVILTWPMILAPAMLVIPLTQNRVFALNQSAWELASRAATDPFALQYLPENLGHALGFFFDATGYQPNSPVFAAVGLLASAFFIVWIVRVFRNAMAVPPAHVAVALMGCGLFAVWALLMVYFWGQFDDPVIHRLSLPVHLLMALAIAAVGASVLRQERGWKILCGAALVGLVFYSLPVMSRRAYGSSYSPAAEMEWRTEFLQRHPERDYLFIDNDSVFWIAHQVAATALNQALDRKEGLIFHLRNDSFSAMYVMQHFRVDPETGVRVMEPTDDLGPDFVLEPLWERRIGALFIGRISRITEIRNQGRVAARSGYLSPGSGPARSTAEMDAAKNAYVDHWLKHLP